jgi:hypothetical protein
MTFLRFTNFFYSLCVFSFPYFHLLGPGPHFMQCDDKVVIDEEKNLLTHVNGAEIVMNKKYKIVLPVVLGMRLSRREFLCSFLI